VSRRERRAGPARPATGSGPVARAGRAPAPTGVSRAPAPATPGPAPPPWRDPWALATALAVVPLLVRCAGAPLGEAVAEDFDFLRRSLFSGMGSLLDGGGSSAFWRPVAHQVYYAALGPLIVSRPLAVAMLHVALLLAGSLLVYRALRPHLGGTVACVAASFPMLSESTRTLVSWPSQFVDVGLYFFSAVSLHETARRRLPSALASTLLALFCKELAVIPALLLPWFPDARPREERRRWAIAFGALVVLWAIAYLAVRRSAGLHLPHGLEQDAQLLATPWHMRVSWALGGTLRALVSLPLARAPEDALAIALAIGLGVAFAARFSTAPAVRARLRERRAWIAWGGAWFAAGALALVSIFPLWQPNRAQFASTGAGVAAAAALEAAHPALAGALVLGRGVLLFLAPAAASSISEDAPDAGAFMDFARLTRLQRFMALTRRALHAQYPHAEPHAHVVEMNLPHGLMYALGGNRAVQVWYRDTTLSMVNFQRLNADSTLAMVAGVQFQPRSTTPIVLLPPDAMREQDRAFRRITAGQWDASFAPLAVADSLTPDARDVVFHADNAGYRAFALLQLHRYDEAEAEARRSLALIPTERNALLVLGSALAMRGRFDEALEPVDHLLRLDPGEASAQRLRASIVAGRDAARR
jgi:tetratricopeptide (TPR) repeat protein